MSLMLKWRVWFLTGSTGRPSQANWWSFCKAPIQGCILRGTEILHRPLQEACGLSLPIPQAAPSLRKQLPVGEGGRLGLLPWKLQLEQGKEGAGDRTTTETGIFQGLMSECVCGGDGGGVQNARRAYFMCIINVCQKKLMICPSCPYLSPQMPGESCLPSAG